MFGLTLYAMFSKEWMVLTTLYFEKGATSEHCIQNSFAEQ